MTFPDESRDVIGKSQEIWNWLVGASPIEWRLITPRRGPCNPPPPPHRVKIFVKNNRRYIGDHKVISTFYQYVDFPPPPYWHSSLIINIDAMHVGMFLLSIGKFHVIRITYQSTKYESL